MSESRTEALRSGRSHRKASYEGGGLQIGQLHTSHVSTPTSSVSKPSLRRLTQLQLDRLLSIAAEAGARLSGNQSAAFMTAQTNRIRTLTSESPHIGQSDIGYVLRAELLDDADDAECWTMHRLDDVVLKWWESIEANYRRQATSFCGTRASWSDFDLGRRSLFVASMVEERAGRIMHGFAAMMAVDLAEVLTRLSDRVGIRVAEAAIIINGFDPSEPIAASLLSDAMANLLMDVARQPDSVLARGLDIFVEHRFR